MRSEGEREVLSDEFLYVKAVRGRKRDEGERERACLREMRVVKARVGEEREGGGWGSGKKKTKDFEKKIIKLHLSIN